MIYILVDLIVAGVELHCTSTDYYSQNLYHSSLNVFSTVLFKVICTEIIIPNGKNIVVASVYRAPNTDLSLLNDHIGYIFNTCKNKKVYLCRDFNVDLLKYSCHDTTSNFIDQLYSYMVYIH